MYNIIGTYLSPHDCKKRKNLGLSIADILYKNLLYTNGISYLQFLRAAHVPSVQFAHPRQQYLHEFGFAPVILLVSWQCDFDTNY